MGEVQLGALGERMASLLCGLVAEGEGAAVRAEDVVVVALHNTMLDGGFVPVSMLYLIYIPSLCLCVCLCLSLTLLSLSVSLFLALCLSAHFCR